MICGSLMAIANGLIPSLGAMIYGKMTDELVIHENYSCTLNESITSVRLRNLVTLEMIHPRLEGINVTETKSLEVTVNETGIQVKVVGLNGELLNQTVFEGRNSTRYNTTSVFLNGTTLNGTELTGIEVNGTRVDTVKSKERISVKQKDSIGPVQSIKMLPVTPTSKVLPETNNVNYTLRNITENCRLSQNRIEEKMSKYALYYVYAAIGTLLFALGQNVMWNITSERAVKNLSENLTDAMLDKDPGFYDTKIHEGVVNLESIT